MSEPRREPTARHEDADALRWIAFAITLGFAGLIVLFVGGYAVTDPGGAAGIGGTAAVLAAVLGLSVLAWYRPGTALVLAGVAACGPLAFGVWSLLDYGAAHAWEDGHGPASLVLVVAVSAPAAVAGLVRPVAAGYLVLTVSIVPLVLAAVGATTHFYEPLSVGVVLSPLVVAGVLLVLSGRRREPSPTVRPATS